MIDVIKPTWNARSTVQAVSTTRQGGFSVGRYRGLNLATHVGDDEQAVLLNRQALRRELALTNEPAWLQQVHGTALVSAHTSGELIADACYATSPGVVCAVMTADCLPILLCDHAATIVVAIHAGWRGIIQGIISKTVHALSAPGRRWLAWIGPGISAQAYQVGADLRERFIAMDAGHAAFFQARDDTHWADLAGLAQHQLLMAGVAAIDRYPGCTAGEPDRFYSFRRDGLCGRMASLIWLA